MNAASLATLDAVRIKPEHHSEFWCLEIKDRIGCVLGQENGVVHLRWRGTDDMETRLPARVLERMQ